MNGYDIFDLAAVTIEDQREAEIATERATRFLALCKGDQSIANAQRLLDIWPGLLGWANQAALGIGTALANGLIAGIRPGVHLRFRPLRRTARRAHSQRVKRG